MSSMKTTADFGLANFLAKLDMMLRISSKQSNEIVQLKL